MRLGSPIPANKDRLPEGLWQHGGEISFLRASELLQYYHAMQRSTVPCHWPFVLAHSCAGWLCKSGAEIVESKGPFLVRAGQRAIRPGRSEEGRHFGQERGKRVHMYVFVRYLQNVYEDDVDCALEMRVLCVFLVSRQYCRRGGLDGGCLFDRSCSCPCGEWCMEERAGYSFVLSKGV
jgi:hypothetical protein